MAPTEIQTQHEHAASGNHALFASVNHGAPPIGATAKAGVFTGHGITATKGLKVSHTPNSLAAGMSPPGKPNFSEDHTKFKTTNTTSFGNANSSQFKSGGPNDRKGFKQNQVHAASGQHKNAEHGPTARNEQHAHSKSKKLGQPG